MKPMTKEIKAIKYYEQYNVGKAKYVVNYYTGEKHADGSDFYGIAIFRNKVAKNEFIKRITKETK